MIKVDRNNLDEIAFQYLNKIKQIKHRKRNPIVCYYYANIDQIILALPSDFEKIDIEFKKIFEENKESSNDFKNYMMYKYEIMCKKHGYWLAKELNINTCPYCNRQYTFTINNRKKIRPQFDHFRSKDQHPYLALSFYNLIPCCPTCNLIKSNTENKLLHPYFEGFDDKCLFDINHKNFMFFKEPIAVELYPVKGCDEDFKDKCKNNIEVFALKELYQKHSDYIEEIIYKAYSYNEEYYNGLIEEYTKIGKTTSEIHRLIFGNYIDKADNEKRPLSKLTHDLLKQMGIR